MYLIIKCLEILKILKNPEIIFENHRTDRNNIIDKLMREASIKKCNLVVSITEALRKKYYSINNKNITITCCADGELFKKEHKDKSYYKKRLCIENKFVIMYTGSLKEYTGVRDVVELANRLDNPEIQIVIVGGDFMQIQELKKMNVKNNILFTGYVPYNSVPQYQRAADVLIVPMRRTGPGGNAAKIVEYLFADAVVIATDTVTNREIISDEINGRLYPVGDIHYLKNLIIQLYKHPEKCIKYREEIKKRIKTCTFKYKADRIHKELIC